MSSKPFDKKSNSNEPLSSSAAVDSEATKSGLISRHPIDNSNNNSTIDVTTALNFLPTHLRDQKSGSSTPISTLSSRRPSFTAEYATIARPNKAFPVDTEGGTNGSNNQDTHTASEDIQQSPSRLAHQHKISLPLIEGAFYNSVEGGSFSANSSSTTWKSSGVSSSESFSNIKTPNSTSQNAPSNQTSINTSPLLFDHSSNWGADPTAINNSSNLVTGSGNLQAFNITSQSNQLTQGSSYANTDEALASPQNRPNFHHYSFSSGSSIHAPNASTGPLYSSSIFPTQPGSNSNDINSQLSPIISSKKSNLASSSSSSPSSPSNQSNTSNNSITDNLLNSPFSLEKPDIVSSGLLRPKRSVSFSQGTTKKLPPSRNFVPSFGDLQETQSESKSLESTMYQINQLSLYPQSLSHQNSQTPSSSQNHQQQAQGANTTSGLQYNGQTFQSQLLQNTTPRLTGSNFVSNLRNNFNEDDSLAPLASGDPSNTNPNSASTFATNQYSSSPFSLVQQQQHPSNSSADFWNSPVNRRHSVATTGSSSLGQSNFTFGNSLTDSNMTTRNGSISGPIPSSNITIPSSIGNPSANGCIGGPVSAGPASRTASGSFASQSNFSNVNSGLSISSMANQLSHTRVATFPEDAATSNYNTMGNTNGNYSNIGMSGDISNTSNNNIHRRNCSGPPFINAPGPGQIAQSSSSSSPSSNSSSPPTSTSSTATATAGQQLPRPQGIGHHPPSPKAFGPAGPNNLIVPTTGTHLYAAMKCLYKGNAEADDTNDIYNVYEGPEIRRPIIPGRPITGEKKTLSPDLYKYFVNDPLRRNVALQIGEDGSIAGRTVETCGIAPYLLTNLIVSPTNNLIFAKFKSGRIDGFFIGPHDNFDLKVGDLIVVDADRGRDLGQVVRLNVTLEEVGLLKLRQAQEQQAALTQSQCPDTPEALLEFYDNYVHYDTNRSSKKKKRNMSRRRNNNSGTNNRTQGGTKNNGSSNDNSEDEIGGEVTPLEGIHAPISIKQVLGYARYFEISTMACKEESEVSAVAWGLVKVAAKRMEMNIIDAEFQWDGRKLTLFYTSPYRIDFRELVRDVFKVYKTRIWMCAVLDRPTEGINYSLFHPHPEHFEEAAVYNGEGPPFTYREAFENFVPESSSSYHYRFNTPPSPRSGKDKGKYDRRNNGSFNGYNNNSKNNGNKINANNNNSNSYYYNDVNRLFNGNNQNYNYNVNNTWKGNNQRRHSGNYWRNGNSNNNPNGMNINKPPYYNPYGNNPMQNNPSNGFNSYSNGGMIPVQPNMPVQGQLGMNLMQVPPSIQMRPTGPGYQGFFSKEGMTSNAIITDSRMQPMPPNNSFVTPSYPINREYGYGVLQNNASIAGSQISSSMQDNSKPDNENDTAFSVSN